MDASLKQLAASILGVMVAVGLVLFLAAGTLAWPAAWVFLVVYAVFSWVLSLWLRRYDPALLSERMHGIGKPGQKAWDKVFLGLMGLGFFGWLAVMGLDAVRFRWSHLPGWLQGVGLILLLGSFGFFYLTCRENPYLSPAVRIQRERGQTVVSTGLYRYVRHPMYSGFILFSIGTALLLGSGYGVLGALVLIVMLAWRAVREERVLLNELPGYRDYMARVRYRFIPFVW
jgi:protein-S-isoprenylcysteine O-methyltransferase Ste14